jgi:hypothetical protein
MAQRVENPVLLVDREALGRQRWPGNVATQLLESATALRWHVDTRV